MHKALWIVCLCLSTTLTYAAATEKNTDINSNTDKKVISVRADEWMPYNGLPNALLPGYLIEIGRYAFNKHGYTMDYKVQSWERSLDQVSKGEEDCVVGAYKSEARDFIFHKNILGNEDLAFYARKDARAWKYTGIDAFKGHTLGVIGGYSYGPEIDFYIANPNNDVHIAKGDDALERNIKMLLTKRIDILAESPTVFSYYTKNFAPAVNIKELDRRNKPQEVYYACSPNSENSKRYVDMIDQAIVELRKSGELKKILAKYGLRDWE